MPSWLTIVLALGGSALISALVGDIVKRTLANEFKKKDELEELRAEKQRKERSDELAEALKSELQPIHDKLDKLSDAVDNGMTGTVTLMRETMKQTRDQFITQGYASASDIASWHELYNTYKKLGGNHFAEYVDAWKEDIEALPRAIIREQEENI